jgi:hypothetical protein
MKVDHVYGAPVGVTIHLSIVEAERVFEVLGSISGDPEHPIRQICSQLYGHLKGAGCCLPMGNSFMPGYQSLRVKEAS